MLLQIRCHFFIVHDILQSFKIVVARFIHVVFDVFKGQVVPLKSFGLLNKMTQQFVCIVHLENIDWRWRFHGNLVCFAINSPVELVMHFLVFLILKDIVSLIMVLFSLHEVAVFRQLLFHLIFKRLIRLNSRAN